MSRCCSSRTKGHDVTKFENKVPVLYWITEGIGDKRWFFVFVLTV